MNPFDKDRMIEAAAHTIISERCRDAYLHDLRGGLQALAGALELLARLAQSGTGAAPAVDKACKIAKRALENHERALQDVLEQLAAQDGGRSRVELGALIEESVRFLRNDLAARQIQVDFVRGEPIVIEVEERRLRRLLAGLVAFGIDDCAPGAQLRIGVRLAQGDAVLDLGWTLKGETACAAKFELVLSMARHWLAARGGRLESDDPGTERAVRIFYPAATAA